MTVLHFNRDEDERQRMANRISMVATEARLLLKRVGQLPGLGTLVTRLWNTYEHVKFNLHIRRNLRSEEWKAVIDPYRVYWVPTDLIKIMSSPSFDFINDTAQVINGPWDKSPNNIEDSSYYQGFEAVLCHGVSWEQTEFYKTRVQRIRGGRSKRYATVKEFEEKLEQYEHMFEQFKNGNYKLQSELVGDDKERSLGDGGRALFPSFTDHTLMRHEIAVNVGRDGTLLRNDGRHRLALALLAGLDKIPVRIVVRHTDWQELRDEVSLSIDEGLDDGVPAKRMYEHVGQTLEDDLEPVVLGLEHPDLDVIFKRRLPHE